MPDLAVIINVGRAEVVDEDAMWAALQHRAESVGCARLAYGADVWWAEGLPAAAVKRGATVQPNTVQPTLPRPTTEEGIPHKAETVPKSPSASQAEADPEPEPEPEAQATTDVFDSLERKHGSKYPMHELDNVVMTPHYGGGRGLPGVEPARANALGELIATIVKQKRWPIGANLEMGY